MIKPKSLYHAGIAVNDIDRARDFYSNVLGLTHQARLGSGKPPDPENPNRGLSPYLDVFTFPNGDELVLFQRATPREKNTLAEDSEMHQAFEMDWGDYDEALETARTAGALHKTVERESGKTIYLFDPEGNYIELHFGNPAFHREWKQ
jgi:catechol 2,3-dioxygenase-like lactoylglutathione lyase family enzyme